MKLILMTMTLFFYSCASHQGGYRADLIDGNTGKVIGNDIDVTSSVDEDFSTSHFTFAQVQFLNNTDDYFDVEKVTVGDEYDELVVVTGNRLRDWSMSIENKIAIDRNNKSVAWGALTAAAAIGAVSSANNGSYDSAKTYTAVTAGAVIGSDINNAMDRVSDLERGKLYPSGHLYTKFSLPPGLVSKKWIVFQHGSDEALGTIAMNVYLKNGEKKQYFINLDY